MATFSGTHSSCPHSTHNKLHMSTLDSITMSTSRARKQLKSIPKLGVKNFLAIAAAVIATTLAVAAACLGHDEIVGRLQTLCHAHLFMAGFLPAAAVIIFFVRKRPEVYVVDYACFNGSHRHRAPHAYIIESARLIPTYREQSIRFLTRLLESSGIGEETNAPPPLQYIPPDKYCTLEAAREEAELVVFSAIDTLFAKTNLLPETIDMLIVNCSGFNPTPSFPDIIVNKYKMRTNIRSVHLAGMGCSAGMISLELARNLLVAAPRGARALVVSTETLTPHHYTGNERAMLLPYVLFRMGGAAVLMSTSPTKARFRIRTVVRTLTAADDNSYQCIQQEEDIEGNRGVNLSMDLMVVAGRTLKANATTLAPVVLPVAEQLLFAASFVSRKLINCGLKLYVPNFLTAFEHFCIHAGGRAVIDEVQRSLGLSDIHVEPSRMTLHRFGNTSSSSTWYELAYIEAKGRMCLGDRVWMMGFGSGFKCNSVVLECIIPARNLDGPWAGCIHRYPVYSKSSSK